MQSQSKYEIREVERNGETYKKVYLNDEPLLSPNALTKPLRELIYGNSTVPQHILKLASQRGKEMENGVEKFLKTKNLGKAWWCSNVSSTQEKIRRLCLYLKNKPNWELVSRNELVYKDNLMCILDFVFKGKTGNEINVELKTSNYYKPEMMLYFGVQCYIQSKITGRPTYLLWANNKTIKFERMDNIHFFSDLTHYLETIAKEGNISQDNLKNYLNELDIANNGYLRLNYNLEAYI